FDAAASASRLNDRDPAVDRVSSLVTAPVAARVRVRSASVCAVFTATAATSNPSVVVPVTATVFDASSPTDKPRPTAPAAPAVFEAAPDGVRLRSTVPVVFFVSAEGAGASATVIRRRLSVPEPVHVFVPVV